MDDIQATFLHRFTALARTRLANALDAVTKRDPAGMQTTVRDMHSLAGEAGLLGLREVVPLARSGEDRAKKMCAEPTDETVDAVIATIREIGSAVERLAAGARPA